MHLSEGSGSGIEKDSMLPTHLNANWDEEQAFVQVPVTMAPSGLRIVPSCSTVSPVGTSHMLNAGWGEHPKPLASLTVAALVGH
jgi:hypothetical protein